MPATTASSGTDLITTALAPMTALLPIRISPKILAPAPMKTPSSITGTPEIPEPASLLLFGSGLAAFGAGLRRRYAKGKLAAQIQTTEEG